MIDSLQLTRQLVDIDTTNPPGREAKCGSMIADLLTDYGFDVSIDRFALERVNLIARLTGSDPEKGLLVLTRHIDTVPLGSAPLSYDPFSCEAVAERAKCEFADRQRSGALWILVKLQRPPPEIRIFFPGCSAFSMSKRSVRAALQRQRTSVLPRPHPI